MRLDENLVARPSSLVTTVKRSSSNWNRLFPIRKLGEIRDVIIIMPSEMTISIHYSKSTSQTPSDGSAADPLPSLETRFPSMSSSIITTPLYLSQLLHHRLHHNPDRGRTRWRVVHDARRHLLDYLANVDVLPVEVVPRAADEERDVMRQVEDDGDECQAG